jgi:hypothetical protein
VLRGAAGEDLAEPGLDPLEVLIPCGKDAGLDEQVAHVVQGGGLGLLVEQGVGELPVMGCCGQRGQEPAAGLAIPQRECRTQKHHQCQHARTAGSGGPQLAGWSSAAAYLTAVI